MAHGHEHEHHHDRKKAAYAFGELLSRFLERTNLPPLSEAQRDALATGVFGMFDLAGVGTLTTLKDALADGADANIVLESVEPLRAWVKAMQDAGPYANEGGTDSQAQNCAGEICC